MPARHCGTRAHPLLFTTIILVAFSGRVNPMAAQSDSLSADSLAADSVYVVPSCFLRGGRRNMALRPSPFDSITLAIEGDPVVDIRADTMKICYGRPSTGGQQMFGGEVPYGELWRMGANEATHLHIPFFAVKAQGHDGRIDVLVITVWIAQEKVLNEGQAVRALEREIARDHRVESLLLQPFEILECRVKRRCAEPGMNL